ncbi:hypothetical protein NDU88_003012 [Pleurodeles waltl]|uniref:Uncharacterized protein n=1 Tax=Pleurodeles waltl TaxID=8319 RepID=A0AAV7M290_PLEWA|nr:hypothetical protein NDU88_003012 [Pleurodeles waltl]
MKTLSQLPGVPASSSTYASRCNVGRLSSSGPASREAPRISPDQRVPKCATALQAVSPTTSSLHCAVGSQPRVPRYVPRSTTHCSRGAPTRHEADPAHPGDLADRAPGCGANEVPHLSVRISDIAASSSRIFILPPAGCCSVTGHFNVLPTCSHVRPPCNRRAQGFRLHIGRTHRVSTAMAWDAESVSTGTRLPPLRFRHYPIMCRQWMAMSGRIYLLARVGAAF